MFANIKFILSIVIKNKKYNILVILTIIFVFNINSVNYKNKNNYNQILANIANIKMRIKIDECKQKLKGIDL